HTAAPRERHAPHQHKKIPPAAPKHVAEQQSGREAQDHATQQGYCLDSPSLMQRRKQDIGQPLPREPRRIRRGEQKYILMGYGAMRQNVVAGADMPAGIAISEQSLSAATKEDPQKQCPEEKIRERWREHTSPADTWF